MSELTTQASCGNCACWRKDAHPRANWGVCTQIFCAWDNDIKAHLSGLNPLLHTQQEFWCAEWKQKPSQEYTIVDAAREASQKLMRGKKETR